MQRWKLLLMHLRHDMKTYKIVIILILTGCSTTLVNDDNCQELASEFCTGLMLNPLRESICEIRMTTSCMNGKGWGS
jgi:hypothetical protein